MPPHATMKTATEINLSLSWSPNGAHICAANAVNGAHCIAAIIDRNNWTTEVSLVGHQMPITATVSWTYKWKNG